MIVGAVCARGGSKGVPRKNLRMLQGKSLLARAVECALACPELDQVVVSTDDDMMAAAGQAAGARVPFMRPAALAQDHSSKWEVFRHLVEELERLDGQRVDMLVDLDTGVPLRCPEDISGCIQQLLASGADVVTTAYEPDRNPYFNMVELDDAGFAHIVKQPAKPIAYRQAAPKVYGLSPAVFAIRRDILWEVDHWSQSKFQLYEMPRHRAVDIDTETDLKFIEYLLQG